LGNISGRTLNIIYIIIPPKYFLKGKVHINTTKKILLIIFVIAIIIGIFAGHIAAWFWL